MGNHSLRGATSEWIHKGPGGAEFAEVDAIVLVGGKRIRYRLVFTQLGGRFEITDERVEFAEPEPGHSDPYFFYRFQAGKPVLNTQKSGKRSLQREDIDPQKSILVQRRDPDSYPELGQLADLFGAIRCYRGWPVTPDGPLRQPQRADGPNSYLLEDASNLALVLNRISKSPPDWRALRTLLQSVYGDIDDVFIDVDGSTVRVMIREKWFVTSSARMSDGTLRFLCLLAVLLDPKPAPLVCLDEPELGLHPDVIHNVADLLVETSTRTQLIVTTHSRELLDAISDHPESVAVLEKSEGRTTIRRLGGEKLIEWLREYGIGRAWRDGEIGGNRWRGSSSRAVASGMT